MRGNCVTRRDGDRHPLIRELKKSQDTLGELHDRQTLIDEWVGESETKVKGPIDPQQVTLFVTVAEAECRDLHRGSSRTASACWSSARAPPQTVRRRDAAWPSDDRSGRRRRRTRGHPATSRSPSFSGSSSRSRTRIRSGRPYPDGIRRSANGVKGLPARRGPARRLDYDVHRAVTASKFKYEPTGDVFTLSRPLEVRWLQNVMANLGSDSNQNPKAGRPRFAKQ